MPKHFRHLSLRFPQHLHQVSGHGIGADGGGGTTPLLFCLGKTSFTSHVGSVILLGQVMLHVRHVGVKVLFGLKETSIGNIAQARAFQGGDTSGFKFRTTQEVRSRVTGRGSS